MSSHYFDIACIKSSNVHLYLIKHGAIIKYVLLATRRKDAGNFYYIAISNDWLTLNKNSLLKAIDDFNY